MLGALGSPIRSPTAFQRQLRSAPASPLPLSGAHRAVANINAASGGSSSNALPQALDSPTTPTRAAPLSTPLSGFQPLHDGTAATNFPRLLLVPSPQEYRLMRQGSGLRNHALPAANPELGGPSGLLDILLPTAGHVMAVSGNDVKAADIDDPAAGPAGLFRPDPDGSAAHPPPLPRLSRHHTQPEPQPPPQVNLHVFAPEAGRDHPGAAVPPAAQLANPPYRRLEQLQRMDDQLQQHWHIWAQLLQQVQEQMRDMHQQVQQAQQMHQEMQMEVQALQQQAAHDIVQELAGPGEAPDAVPGAAGAAAAGVAPVEGAPAPAVPAEPPAEVPVAKPHPRDPNADLEPGVWLVKEEPQQHAVVEAAGGSNKMSETVLVFLRSLDSKKRTRVLFVNETGRSITAFWLNYAGQEVPYGTLLSGQAKVYETYVSHPWIFRCSTSGSRMLAGDRMAHYAEEMAVAPSGGLGAALGRRGTRQPQPQRVAIMAPPPLKHSRETHAAFPADYKASSRALLLAHQRLQRPDLQAAAAASAATAAASKRSLAETVGRAFRTTMGALILAAEPAMQAIGVWGPSTGDSDTCRMRWLDGTILRDPHKGDGSRHENENENERVRRNLAPESPGVACRTAAGVTPDATAAAELLAPGSVQMRAESPQRNVGPGGADGASGPRGPTPRPSGKNCQRRESVHTCNLPARTAAKLKADTEAVKYVAGLGDLLAELPRDLVHLIIHFMAPHLTQHVALHPLGHPDILPALLPSDPVTWPPLSSAAAEQNA